MGDNFSPERFVAVDAADNHDGGATVHVCCEVVAFVDRAFFNGRVQRNAVQRSVLGNNIGGNNGLHPLVMAGAKQKRHDKKEKQKFEFHLYKKNALEPFMLRKFSAFFNS